MAKNIFMDSLNNRELMDAFGIQQDNAPMTPEELQALSEEQNQVESPEVIPVMPENAMMETQNNPMTEEVSQNTPTVSNVPRNTMQDGKVNQETPPTPRSRMETLLEEYNKLSREGMDEVKAARESDRMLKVGGALGDALATIINARSQMNVKAPGVQVRQGAGLGKIADMFATAPEVQSDIAERREALMEQYRQLARGEESAASRDLRERQIAAYEAQTRAQAKKAEADEKRQTKKTEEKLSVGEETVDREFAKKFNTWSTQGKADYEENSKILKEAINKLEKGEVSTGTAAGIGSRLPGVRTETRELETRVRKALNGMLRATLGAQFTQEEGERIFQQTFDPFASSEENIKNMQTELNKLEKQKNLIEDQGKVFKERGTLRGYNVPSTLEKSQSIKPGTIIRSGGKRYRIIDEQGSIEEVK